MAGDNITDRGWLIIVISVKKESFATARIKSGYSITRLAKTVGAAQSYMSLIVNNKKNPSPEMAKRICDALNVKFDDVFYIKGNNKMV